MCKFGEYCSYEHEKIIDKKEDIKAMIDVQIVKVNNNVRSVEDEITKLKKEIFKLSEENKALRSQMNHLKETKNNENEIDNPKTVKKDTEHFKCDECNSKCKSEAGLKLHKKKKHDIIPQIDGTYETIEKSDNGEAKKDKSTFKVEIYASPGCTENDIRESIEINFLEALEDNQILDEDSKIIVIKKDIIEDSESNIYNIEVKNSLEVIKSLKTQFDPINYDNICFPNAVQGKMFMDCVSIEEV